MKNRVVSLILALLILISIPTYAKADTTEICFTAVGDFLLELSSMASFTGGNVYVPAKVFSSFGVYLNYFESTAYMYNDSKKIFFNTSTGNSYNESGTTYSVSAILKNGQVYVPIGWMCTYFGLSYSYITGTGNGDIVRLKNGTEALTDSEFLNAAGQLMKSRYNEYFGIVTPVAPTPTPTPSPAPTEPSDEETKQNTCVFLAFTGTPSSSILDLLDRYSYSASFFVTNQDAKEKGDLLRRIYGSGHNIGVYFQSAPEEEFDAASDAIFDAVQIRPTFVSSPSAISSECAKFGSTHGLADFSPSISISESDKSAAAAISKLDNSSGYLSVSIALGENSQSILSSLFKYLSSNHYTVLALLETYI